MKIERSGKSGAINIAIRHFGLVNKYKWIQIMDADSIFDKNYFSEISKFFKNKEIVAICGQVKSIKNNWITSYRSYQYTIGHDIYKNFQSLFNLIAVMPGAASCFRTSILKNLDLPEDTLTEDFDITLQIHHKKLGKILFVPKAISYTQDPYNLHTYYKQIKRWYTGYYQVLKKYKVGSKFRAIDIVLILLTLDGITYFLQILFYIFYSFITKNALNFIYIFSFDFLILLSLCLYAAGRNKRFDILTPIPLYYVLRTLDISVFILSAFNVLLRKPQPILNSWNMERVNNNPLPSKGGEK